MKHIRKVAAVCALAGVVSFGGELKGQVVRAGSAWGEGVEFAMAGAGQAGEAPPDSQPALEVGSQTKPATRMAMSRRLTFRIR